MGVKGGEMGRWIEGERVENSPADEESGRDFTESRRTKGRVLVADAEFGEEDCETGLYC